jgi:hypothetical protein
MITGTTVDLPWVDTGAIDVGEETFLWFRAAMPILSRGTISLVLLGQAAIAFAGWEHRPLARAIACSLSLGIVAIGAFDTAIYFESLNGEPGLIGDLVEEPGTAFRVRMVLSVTSAAAIVWWIADRITATERAHGFLVVALALGASMFPVFAFETGAAWMQTFVLIEYGEWVLGAVALAALVLAALPLVRPAAWPVRLAGRFELRSAGDLVALPFFLLFALGGAIQTVMYSDAFGARAWTAYVLPAIVLALAALLAAFWFRVVPPKSGSRSIAPFAITMALVVLTAGLGAYGYERSGGSLFAPAPLEGDAAFDLTLRADEGFYDRDAEAMVSRLEELGASASVLRASEDEIVLHVEDALDSESVVRAISPADLAVHLVLSEYAGELPDPRLEWRGSRRGIAGPCDAIEDAARSARCYAAIADEEDGCVLYCLDRQPVLTHEDIFEAHVAVDAENEPLVVARAADEGARALVRATMENVGHPLAIVVDGRVVAAPIIAGTIRDRFEIRPGGLRDREEKLREARILAEALGMGRRPRTQFRVASVRDIR